MKSALVLTRARDYELVLVTVAVGENAATAITAETASAKAPA